jgi:prevent-host-death family protein
MGTKAVGIRELKTHLSRYVKEVKKGDEILVSERGRVVARLMPIEPYTEEARLRVLLLKMSSEGQIIAPKTHKKAKPPARRKKVEGTSFSDAVIEGRR